MKKLIRNLGVLLLAVVAVKLCAMAASGTLLTLPESVSDRLIELEFGSPSAEASAMPLTEPSYSPSERTEPTEAPGLTLDILPSPEASEPSTDPLSPFFTLDRDGVMPSMRPQEPKATLPPGFTYHVPDIDNETSVAIDAMAMLQEVPKISIASDGPTILILHTHGSEAFLSTDGYRTLDTTKNIVRVGDALAAELQDRGFNVIHDRTCYDYPSYNGSYNRSADAAKAWIAKYPTIQVVFDIHRDSLELPDGSPKATVNNENGTRTAQVMIIATNGDNGLSHPNWKENFKFALRLQSSAESLHSTLMRPLVLRGQRYNEHLAPGYLLLEVGSTGNTVEESVAAVRLFSESLAYVLDDIR